MNRPPFKAGDKVKCINQREIPGEEGYAEFLIINEEYVIHTCYKGYNLSGGKILKQYVVRLEEEIWSFLATNFKKI